MAVRPVREGKINEEDTERKISLIYKKSMMYYFISF